LKTKNCSFAKGRCRREINPSRNSFYKGRRPEFGGGFPKSPPAPLLQRGEALE